MTTIKKTISYIQYSSAYDFKVRAFWVMICVFTAFLALYIYSVYSAVDLSYKIENGMQALRMENQAYQKIEERYAAKLEGLREDGFQILGLTVPKTQIFIDRYSAVALTGL